MIESIAFHDFRVLERATLPLGAFNLLLGPNGSGKTTALRALLALGAAARGRLGGGPARPLPDLGGASVRFTFGGPLAGGRASLRFGVDGVAVLALESRAWGELETLEWLARIQGHVLDPLALARPVEPAARPRLASDGAGLAGVLADLREGDGARWAALVRDFRALLPEFGDVIAGQTTAGGVSFSVVTTRGRALAPANLSQGTLVLLGVLALVHARERASVLCLEELERGMHPRLLRDVRDLLYRLAFPEDCGEPGPAAQIVATTHSPYVLDLFADTPEDVILATKQDGAAVFRRLDTVPELREMLASGRLGDLWYSGVLGGVP